MCVSCAYLICGRLDPLETAVWTISVDIKKLCDIWLHISCVSSPSLRSFPGVWQQPSPHIPPASDQWLSPDQMPLWPPSPVPCVWHCWPFLEGWPRAAVKPCQGPTGDQNSNSCWKKSGFCCDRSVQHLCKDRPNFKFPQNAHWFNNHKPENMTNVF